MKTRITTTPRPGQPTEGTKEPCPRESAATNPMSESIYTLVSQQPFFNGLNAHQLQLLADSAMLKQFEAGESIFEAGSPANRFYLILEGNVVLEAELAERRTIPIQTLGPGDDLGWSWLFPPYYLHLSARALTPTRTIFFYGTRLRAECEQDHDLGYEIMKRIAEVATQCLQATQQRLIECTGTINQQK